MTKANAAVEEFALTPPESRQLTPMDLMQQLIQRGDVANAVDVAKELVALQAQMWNHELSVRKVDAELDFNQELAAAHAEMQLIVNDSEKTGPGGKRWATYRAIDKAVRPIWKAHGFSLSFGSSPSQVPNQMTMEAYLSRGLYTRTYSLPMDIGGLGPKGEGALSKPHAIGAGVEYGRRYLIKMIFNLVTGEEDVMTNGELMAAVEDIGKAPNIAELQKMHKEAFAAWQEYPGAIKALQEARNKRHKELMKNAAH